MNSVKLIREKAYVKLEEQGGANIDLEPCIWRSELRLGLNSIEIDPRSNVSHHLN